MYNCHQAGRHLSFSLESQCQSLSRSPIEVLPFLSQKGAAYTGLSEAASQTKPKTGSRTAPSLAPAERGPGTPDSQPQQRLLTGGVWKRPSPTSSGRDNDRDFSLKCHWHKHSKSNKSGQKKKNLLVKEQSRTCLVKLPTLLQPAGTPALGTPAKYRRRREDGGQVPRIAGGSLEAPVAEVEQMFKTRSG